tara:strand:- start:546 stop:1058 length:513 start_codon:yes stop_codon:yes gene_type:complete
MATTIQQTTLNVSISENISVNGVSYGNNISKTFSGNGKVDQRVMAINSTRLTSVFQYIPSLPDIAGTGVIDEFTYFRITNTDSSVGITIQLYVSATKTGYFHLPAGCSFVLMGNDMDFLCEGESFSLSDLIMVKAKTDVAGKEVTESYIEYVAVFKGGTVEGGEAEEETP